MRLLTLWDPLRARRGRRSRRTLRIRPASASSKGASIAGGRPARPSRWRTSRPARRTGRGPTRRLARRRRLAVRRPGGTKGPRSCPGSSRACTVSVTSFRSSAEPTVATRSALISRPGRCPAANARVFSSRGEMVSRPSCRDPSPGRSRTALVQSPAQPARLQDGLQLPLRCLAPGLVPGMRRHAAPCGPRSGSARVFEGQHQRPIIGSVSADGDVSAGPLGGSRSGRRAESPRSTGRRHRISLLPSCGFAIRTMNPEGAGCIGVRPARSGSRAALPRTPDLIDLIGAERVEPTRGRVPDPPSDRPHFGPIEQGRGLHGQDHPGLGRDEREVELPLGRPGGPGLSLGLGRGLRRTGEAQTGPRRPATSRPSIARTPRSANRVADESQT